MNALTHDFGVSETHGSQQGHQAPELGASWTALHEAANAIAQLAQLAPERSEQDVTNFPELAMHQTGSRLSAIEAGIADLSVVMRTGLTALLNATSKGKDASAAALTLWLEFHAGRRAIMAFARPAN
jgi:hypothetical protein